MIRVFLADDHALVRDGVKRILTAAGMTVVGEASSGEDVIKRAAQETWDVLVCDLSLPGISGLDVVKQLKTLKPRLPVLILTMHAEDQYALRILHAGAAGYITKGSPAEDLLEAIRRVASGGRYVSPTLSELLLNNQADLSRPPHAALTDREMEILLMIARGKTPSLIAADLDLSASTVSTHLNRIKTKLSLSSTGDLVQYAVRAGLLD